MKICKYCGAENPDNRKNCKDCGRSLEDKKNTHSSQNTLRENANDRPTNRQPHSAANLRKTVRESAFDNIVENTGDDLCPKCNYPMEKGICPHCGYNANQSEINTNDSDNEFMENQPVQRGDSHSKYNLHQTIRPHHKAEKEGTFTLTPISEENGEPEGDPISYEGNNVVLDRSNTDPRNHTITSKEQAFISREDGNWTIVDNSEYHTTFVQAKEKIPLSNGTLILLGDQLFEFKS